MVSKGVDAEDNNTNQRMILFINHGSFIMSTTAPKPTVHETTWAKAVVKPGASVFTQTCPTDVQGQAEFFKREGFVILRSVFSAAEIKELHDELDRIANSYKTLPRIREGFGLEPVQDPNRKLPTFRKIGGISDYSQAFNRALKHKRIIDVLHAVFGNTISMYRDVVMMKAARVGREKPWHQDSVYWPYKPMNMASAMTALDDAEPENGCMQVIARTHHLEVQHYGEELQINLTPEQQKQTVYVPLKAGDTLIFHSLLLHGSEPNTSDKDRRVLINSYMPDGLTFVGKGEEEQCVLVSQR